MMENSRRVTDPRWFQVAALSGLLIVGITALDFSIGLSLAATLVITALTIQCLLPEGISGLPSALISSLSLCLLLRTDQFELAAFAAAVAIVSKRVVRFRGQHLFNPTALSLVVTSMLFDGAWISPGQWGHTAYLLIIIAAAGTVVSSRARRLDISLTFLLAYATCCALRAIYLGDPWVIPVHQLSSGALIIFAFFMISDPRTSPRSARGRMLFAALVALLAAVIEFALFRANGAIIALVFCAPLVPLINATWPGPGYAWPERQSTPPISPSYGVPHV